MFRKMPNFRRSLRRRPMLARPEAVLFDLERPDLGIQRLARNPELFAAAPEGPETRPCESAKAVSMIALSPSTERRRAWRSVSPLGPVS